MYHSSQLFILHWGAFIVLLQTCYSLSKTGPMDPDLTFDSIGKPSPPFLPKLFAPRVSALRTIYNQFTANTLTSSPLCSINQPFQWVHLSTDRVPRPLCNWWLWNISHFPSWWISWHKSVMEVIVESPQDASPDRKVWFGGTVNFKVTQNILSSLQIGMKFGTHLEIISCLKDLNWAMIV